MVQIDINSTVEIQREKEPALLDKVRKVFTEEITEDWNIKNILVIKQTKL